MPAPATSDPLRLEDQLCFPLYAAARLVTRLYQPLLEPVGLTYPQYVVLMILWADAPCTMSHIGARAQLASNTLTPLVKRLEQLGWVTRERAAGDERVVVVGLTDAGRALRARCADIPGRLFEAVGLPRAEAVALKVRLDALVRHLEALPALHAPDPSRRPDPP